MYSYNKKMNYFETEKNNAKIINQIGFGVLKLTGIIILLALLGFIK